MITYNGVAVLDEGSKGWVFFTVGRMMPFLNISSTVLISRFWSVRQVSPQVPPQVSPQVSPRVSPQVSPKVSPQESPQESTLPTSAREKTSSATASTSDPVASTSDPAKSQPTRTLLIVFAGLAADVTYIVVVLNSHMSPMAVVLPVAFLLVAIGNFLILAFFFYAGIQVLRSLSSSHKSLKIMASYLLIMAAFTLMIISSFFMVSKE